MLTTANWLGQKYSQLNKAGQVASVAGTVQVLAEKLKSGSSNNRSATEEAASTTAEDRRAAILSLKGISRDHPKQVADHALGPILDVLIDEAAKPPGQADEECMRALVEMCITLCDAMPASSEAVAAKPRTRQQPSHSLQSSDIFLEKPEPLQALLPLLSSKRAFYTRFASLQLLGTLLRNRASRVQEHVLVAPGGCGAILECIAESTSGPGGMSGSSSGARSGSSAEIIRNEALLLLPHLVHGNPDIQKLVAFEGAFEKLLDVVAQEGRIEGGVVVQDALEGLEALLRYNVSNQNYFRETMSVPMLAPLLFFPPPPPPLYHGDAPSRQAEQEHAPQLEGFAFQEWDEQKVLNARLVIGIAGLLVSGQGDGKRNNQNALLQSGMTRCLVELALASTAPVLLKSQALHVLSSMLSASRTTQEMFSNLLVCPILALEQSTDARPPHLTPQGDADAHLENGQHAGAAAAGFVVSPAEDAAGAPAPPIPAPALTYTRLPARPAVLTLIGTALSGPSMLEAGYAHAQLGMRTAALSAFESLVADNVDARLAIIGSMMPAAGESDADLPVTAGGLLLDAFKALPSSSEVVADTEGEGKRFDPYKYLIASMLFTSLVKGSESAKKLARNIAFDHEGRVSSRDLKEGEDPDEDDPRSSLIQTIMGNFTQAIREQADAIRKDRSATAAGGLASGLSLAAGWTRVLVGYLVCLGSWLWDSPASVRDFLFESANMQVLIQPVAQSSGIDPLIQSLSTFVLGVLYEFNTEPGELKRETMHPILHSRIGADNFGVRLLRLRDDPRFRAVGPDVLERVGDAPEATAENQQDGLWLNWGFVEFWKNNFLLVQKSILVEPSSTSASSATASTELLDARRQLDTLRDQVANRTREVQHLAQNLEQTQKEKEEQRAKYETEIAAAAAASQASADSLTALQAELSAAHNGHEVALSEANKSREALNAELDAVREMLSAAESKNSELEKWANEAEEAMRRLKEKVAAQAQMDMQGGAEKEKEERAKMDALEEQIKELKRKLEEGQACVQAVEKEASANIEALEEQIKELKRKVEEGQARVQAVEKEKDEVVQRAKEEAALAASAGMEENKAAAVDESPSVDVRRLQELEKENEDLLVLLEELSTKRKVDKARMRENDLEVSDDDDDDDDDDDQEG
ncbi:hypothetical protein K437DRAFT_258431 [Tilletiaria anomala UBC 951]|uniref:Vesicle tethering protein Uso1/P115-like head domain-containing protein n=1 Tax=Tilletiaria anomala (strain ATCC 24038 / CBS 436.72 / UBC 951) TaxID=1037660 RepID=A0A066VL97_TILAU|nr:uncharacterized protein K437DRAFT_258431 [Tilletiaria anomala UBC 951]KDN41073.1 hypothetical protein K437DRAFT_258431 [Tilletiaria anomala UBC 951]